MELGHLIIKECLNNLFKKDSNLPVDLKKPTNKLLDIANSTTVLSKSTIAKDTITSKFETNLTKLTNSSEASFLQLLIPDYEEPSNKNFKSSNKFFSAMHLVPTP
jgi:hypothetical protein